MSELIKKKEFQPIINKYTVPTTAEMKQKLDELRDELDYDVNEMTRRYWEKLISDAQREQSAS